MELVELGQPCDECGGSGELPQGECPICFGDGYSPQFLTLDELRLLTGVCDAVEP
jgi:DnaJ-class molecular chaperone